MDLTELLDEGLLRRRIEDGFVKVAWHGVHPLVVLNYTARTQYEHAWDKVTSACRGLVVECAPTPGAGLRFGRIVARPLDKFFNLDDPEGIAAVEANAGQPFSVWEKVDGSLFVVVCDHEFGLVTCTRGSFESEQADVGRRLLAMADQDALRQGWTCLFEVVYPDNRIVVDYGDVEELVLLTARDASGDEVAPETLGRLAREVGVRAARRFDVGDVRELAKMIGSDEEGFVVRFTDGARVKVKGVEYIRLHRLLTCTTARSVWEILASGGDVGELLERVPDEFYEWVRRWVERLRDEHASVMAEAHRTVAGVRGLGSRKEQAAALLQLPGYLPGVAFALLDGKDQRARDKVWRELKPEAERPFRVTSEDAA
ncbi:MAG: T4 RnlA family RNA ligase [Egibacteraceae bacterium]